MRCVLDLICLSDVFVVVLVDVFVSFFSASMIALRGRCL